MKTETEVMELKRQWLQDPCWDIEDTEGFEEYRDELRAFRVDEERRWSYVREARVTAKAEEFGCSEALAGYLLRLEDRLETLERAKQS